MPESTTPAPPSARLDVSVSLKVSVSVSVDVSVSDSLEVWLSDSESPAFAGRLGGRVGGVIGVGLDRRDRGSMLLSP